MGLKYPLSLVIQAVDRAGGPLRRLSQQMQRLRRFTAPLRRLSGRLSALWKDAGGPQVAEAFKGVGSSVRNVGKEVWALGQRLATLAAVGAGALYAITRSSVDAGDELAMMADRLDVAVDLYAQLRFSAAQADVEQEDFNKGMGEFSKRLGEAKAGGGALAGLLKRVSPELLKQLKGASGNAEALRLMADAMQGLQEPNKRAALGAAAFGRAGKGMAAWLALGNDAIDEQRARFLELSGSQETFARGAGDVDNAMRETGTALLGLRNTVMGELFPALAQLARVLTSLVAGNRARLAEWARSVGEAFSGWVKNGGVERLVARLKQLWAVGESVVGALGGWKVALAGVAAVVLGPLLGAMGGLISSVVTLGAAIGFTPVGWILAGLAAIAAGVVLLVRNFDAVRAIVGPVFAPLGEALGELWGQLQRLWALLSPVLLPVLKVVGKVMGGVLVAQLTGLSLVLTAIVKLISFAVQGFTRAVGAATASGKAIVEWFTRAWERVKPLADLLQKVFEQTPSGKVFSFLTQTEAARPVLGAAAAAPAGGGVRDAHVRVDFANLPRGARVSADPRGEAPLDLSMGYSMVTP